MNFERIDCNTVVIEGVTYVKVPFKYLRERLTYVCKDVNCDIPLDDVNLHVDNLISVLREWLDDKGRDCDIAGTYGEGWSSCLEDLIDDLK